LDGFNRLRCAERLKIAAVPFLSLGPDEGVAILNLLKVSNAKGLSLLEQALWVDELKRVHGLNIAEIGKHLERSGAWVCVRLNVLSEMTETVSREIFSGRFPSYCFLYTLRHFRRLNGVTKSEMDEFVVAVSGKGLSVRDIDWLARLYFRGGDKLRDQIRSGDLEWSLRRLREEEAHREGLSDFEKKTLRDLELILALIGRRSIKLGSPDLAGHPFFAEAHLMVSGILSRADRFYEVLRRFHDRCREEGRNLVTAPAGDGDSGDISTASPKPQFGAQGITSPS
jgi:hypothetical protein